jgi:drug/metabolite transporter (DMT)-like permease
MLSTKQGNVLVLAVFYMMLSVFCYSLQDNLVKFMAHLPLMQLLFFRSVFALIPVLMLFKICNRQSLWPTSNYKLHFWRAFFSFLATIAFFESFRRIQLAQAYTLTFSCSLFLVLFGSVFLKEKVGMMRWLTVSIGFAGVWIAMDPGNIEYDIGAAIAILGGLVYALSLVCIRKLSYQDNDTAIVFSFIVFSIICSLPFLPFVWEPITINELLILIILGILGGLAQYAMTRSFRLAPVSFLAPFDYLALIWAVLFGYLLWEEIPHITTWVGAFIIIISGYTLLFYENSKKIKTV